jgi:hypothetical protein
MESPSLFPFARRLLFPYSGEHPLSLLQGVRIVLAWMLVFPLPCSLFVGVVLLLGSGTQEAINAFLFAFLSGASVFGLLGLLIVVLSNRAARIRQAWKAQNGRS